MAYFRTIPKLPSMLELFSREERWLICINADPDAMGAAMALKRIMSRRVKDVVIAKVNKITRPDNLSLIRYTRIPMVDLTENNAQKLTANFQRFALVDSQPHHHALFEPIPFSIIIDHHPLPETPAIYTYSDIRPDYGATCTMMTEYLYNLDLRPGKLLATAMQFGIKTDTASFDRHSSDVDLRAYQYLSRFSDHNLLSRIGRSEFHIEWLEYFARAATNMYQIKSGIIVFVGNVDNPDILVTIADLFMRVYEIRWVTVSGIYNETVVIIFRGDGVSRDVGKDASLLFGELGSAGGHKAMARAEFPLARTKGQDAEIFIWQRFEHYPKRRHKKKKSIPEQTTTLVKKPEIFIENDPDFIE